MLTNIQENVKRYLPRRGLFLSEETTFVLANDLAKKQSRWASFKKEKSRVGIEPQSFDIHNVRGGSRAVGCGHTDHGSIMPNRYVQLIRKALVTSKLILEPESRILTGTPSHDTDSGAAANANASTDALVCQGFAGSMAAAAFGAAAAFVLRTGIGAAIAGFCSILQALQ